jgi:tetratricopeptide (TPR) repeat protein
MQGDSGGELQHPRRNLGNRCRSQAERFIKSAKKDPSRNLENLQWAEQNARQSVLHDFTDERNWACLAHVKVLLEDKEGLTAVLDDVFTILGRDPDQLVQLEGINMLTMGYELLSAAFLADPLDPDKWWEQCKNNGAEGELEKFAIRCKRLDFSDQRANIIFGRRLERVLKSGRAELFIELVHHLLAQRPSNHELWMDLGLLHEKRKEWDEAWLCYDHVQQIRPHLDTRDAFRERLIKRLEGKAWSEPGTNIRSNFLQRMQSLASTLESKTIAAQQAQQGSTIVAEEKVEERINPDLVELEKLLVAKDFAAAFFFARRLLTLGEKWAQEYLDKARQGLDLSE